MNDTYKYLAWDIEIVKQIPEGDDWLNHRPLGISCAATLRYNSADDQEKPKLWYAGQDEKVPMSNAMSAHELSLMLDYMVGMVHRGYSILTWNGLGFDFNVLAEESGMQQLCARLAMNHIDMMYHFFCVKGFPVALAKVAEGFGLLGKAEGMTGAEAPVLWAGSEEDRQKVLRYVAGDVMATLAIAKAVGKASVLLWVTRAGQRRGARLGNWLTVEQASKLPVPDSSWMSKPMLREDFMKWIADLGAIVEETE